MALSNYDELAFDETGEPTVGHLACPDGVAVEVYKNWLHVLDEKAWRDGGRFSTPLVIRLTKGDLCYRSLWIKAKRGPKEGVYVLAWTGTGEKLRVLVAIGCYGWENDLWLGIEQEEIYYLQSCLLGWYAEIPQEVKEALGRIDWTASRRFNQGDAFFASTTGSALQSSSPLSGEVANPPMIMGQKKEGEKESN